MTAPHRYGVPVLTKGEYPVVLRATILFLKTIGTHTLARYKRNSYTIIKRQNYGDKFSFSYRTILTGLDNKPITPIADFYINDCIKWTDHERRVLGLILAFETNKDPTSYNTFLLKPIKGINK